jgi:hypothetical protein
VVSEVRFGATEFSDGEAGVGSSGCCGCRAHIRKVHPPGHGPLGAGCRLELCVGVTQEGRCFGVPL